MAKTATQAPIVKMPKGTKLAAPKTTKLPSIKVPSTKATFPKPQKVSKGLYGYLSGSSPTSSFQ